MCGASGSTITREIRLPLLGGTIFTLLDDVAGEQACVQLATALHQGGARPAIERAFGLPFVQIEHRWREHLLAP